METSQSETFRDQAREFDGSYQRVQGPRSGLSKQAGWAESDVRTLKKIQNAQQSVDIRCAVIAPGH